MKGTRYAKASRKRRRIKAQENYRLLTEAFKESTGRRPTSAERYRLWEKAKEKEAS